jgi:hypothetical protein
MENKMNTKEKLELLWKYLFLAVVVVGIFRFTSQHDVSMAPMVAEHFGHQGKHEMVFFGDDDGIFVGDDHEMDVKIKKEIVDGNTIMKVLVNGEEMSVDDYDIKDRKFNWKSKDGKIIVIDIDDDHNGDHKEKDVTIIKKKIIVRDGD